MAPSINQYYSGLEKIPWVSLGNYPTRVEKLENYGDSRGFPNLYIKRDDRSNQIYGGNKVRKLEYMLADAKNKGKETLITLGATGSNQVLATGIFGSELGFEVVGVIMDQPNAEYVRANLLLDKYFNIRLVYAKDTFSEIRKFLTEYIKLQINRNKPYFITAGASTEIGNMGFVNAAFELKQQIDWGMWKNQITSLSLQDQLGLAPVSI